METATRAESHSIGENQDSNSSLNHAHESVSPPVEVSPKVNFSSEEFLRHETNLINKDEHLRPSGNEGLRDNPPQQASDKELSESNINLIANESITKSSDLVGKLDHSVTSESASNISFKENNATEFNGEDVPEKIAESLPKVKQDSESVGTNHQEEPISESVELGEEKDDGPPKSEWMDILGSGHLMKKVLVAGTPDSRPNKSDICLISYAGSLEDGTVVDKAENIKIHLNDNEVIQGIDFALSLMDKGEEAEIKVGPRFAFGMQGRKPDIPSGATLFYNIKLLDVMEEPPVNTMSVNDRISIGLQKKERGNWWYSRGEHSIAINCYRRALEYLDDTDIPEPHADEDVSRLLEEALKTYNNLGASQMKINAFDAALMSLNKVVSAQPKNVKALFRKAQILKEKGELQESINTVRQALSLDPDNQAIQQELSALLAAQRKANSKQRELYKKMMGNSANQGKEKDKKNSSRNNYNALKWVTFISFAVAVIGTIAIKYKS